MSIKSADKLWILSEVTGTTSMPKIICSEGADKSAFVRDIDERRAAACKENY
jgi:hypothetical protein